MKKLSLMLSLFFTANVAVAADQDFMRKVECLAKNIYFEARGESRQGQLAVAHVTINRTKSDKYPDRVCDVVYQKNQFSWTSTKAKIRDYTHYEEIKNLAFEVLIGATDDPTRGSLNFHSTSVRPGWKKRPKTKIGNHIFY